MFNHADDFRLLVDPYRLIMRLIKRSPIRKLICLLRFLICRSFHYRRITGSWCSFIDARCSVYLGSGNSSLRISRNLFVSHDSTIQSFGDLEIGNDVFLNQATQIICRERISIGNNCLFGSYVSVLDHDHRVDFRDGRLTRDGFESTPVSIGDNVWIGEKSTILRGSDIGENSVIGANSVVNGSIPPNCVAAGSPARVVRQLNSKTQATQPSHS